jgi:uncharacterized membrane protein YgcG
VAKLDLRLLLMVTMIGLAPVAAALAQTPILKLANGINDPDRILRPEHAADLSRKLAAFEQKNEYPVVVLIVRDFGRANLIEYSDRALATWTPAPASKGRVILLVVIADRERAWIAEQHTGLKLSTAQRIVWETMVPRFKVGHDIAGGINAGLDQVISVLNGNPMGPPPDPTGAMHSLVDRLDTFRYGLQDPSGSDGTVRELLYFVLGVALGFGLRPFAGRWSAALLAAAVAGFGSWLQYGFIVPTAAGAFVIVLFGWKHWLGKGGSTRST